MINEVAVWSDGPLSWLCYWVWWVYCRSGHGSGSHIAHSQDDDGDCVFSHSQSPTRSHLSHFVSHSETHVLVVNSIASWITQHSYTFSQRLTNSPQPYDSPQGTSHKFKSKSERRGINTTSLSSLLSIQDQRAKKEASIPTGAWSSVLFNMLESLSSPHICNLCRE